MTILFGFLLSLLFQALFFGAETSFVSANKIRLEIFERKRVIGAALAGHFVRNINKALQTILLSQKVFLYIFAALFFALYRTSIGHDCFSVEFLAAITIASITLVLSGKIIPQLLLKELSEYSVLVLAPFVKIFSILFSPLIATIHFFSSQAVALFRLLSKGQNDHTSALDYRILHRIYTPKEVERKDSEIVSNIFAISDVQVRESMIPRTDIHAVPSTITLDELVKVFGKTKYSVVPVYESTIDHIIGVVSVYELFKKPDSLKSVLREALFVPETKKTVELLQEFCYSDMNMAIVVDEFGGTAGLVTSEDLIEELIGDVHNDCQSDDEICHALSENTFLVSGRVDIDTINEKLKLGFSVEEQYETLAGYILSHIGRIPKQGEIFKIENKVFTIARASKTKIVLVKLQLVDS
ncbi:transporter-associated region [Chloroherpeton thalassium ATCC 35110]|uniref:Transporter-associated region n=1 Tax=Chloroherpeton thalassium (strain ATCC 35110 / GB-78) TaxID=517418 RepID=B3QWB4_CHLT3|nr:hemolysin family protein [Chloroherpeton thalassium]ACF13227.1 transporter-associated region [Chloroherpeton thalassium ATCC 35110]